MMKTLQQFISQHSVAPGQTQPGAISIDEVWDHPFSGPEIRRDDSDNYKSLETAHTSSSPDIAEHEKQLVDHYTPTGAKHRNAMGTYKRESRRLNLSLLHDPELKESSKALQKLDSNVSEALSQHKTPHDMHVYSGIGFDPSTIGKHEDGAMKVHLNAYTSTTLEPATAVLFAHYRGGAQGLKDGHIIKIHVPEGSAGMYHHDGNSSSAAAYPHGKEFTMHKNAKLHIHPVPTTDIIDRGKYTSPLNLKIWHAKLVHDGVQPTRHANEET